MEENSLLRHPSFFVVVVVVVVFFEAGYVISLFSFFSDCTNLNSFLLCLHKWHFLVECTMDLVETVIGVNALSILCSLEKMAFLFVQRLIGQRVPFSVYLLQRHFKSVSAFVAC